MTEKQMTEAEARHILEDLARNGPPTAQVAAIKVLRDMDKAARAEEQAAREMRSFEELHPELYHDELTAARRRRGNPGAA